MRKRRGTGVTEYVEEDVTQLIIHSLILKAIVIGDLYMQALKDKPEAIWKIKYETK